jgi:hypothetical protein
MIRDENGKLSSSRIVMFIMVALFCFLSIAGRSVEPVVWNTMQSVILLCLGGASVRGTVSRLGGKND